MSSQPPHISDVAIWGTADRNYWTYTILAIVLGFLGADHIYLRSYGTAFQKFAFNCVSLGFWYWWDIIQALTEREKITKEGISGPFDWGEKVGRGAFGNGPSPPKDYVIYTLLAVFLGFIGADRFYLGQWTTGALKAVSVFFLLGWLWVAFDAANAVFFPRSLVTSSPDGGYGFPFSLIEVSGCHQFTGPASACQKSPQSRAQEGGFLGFLGLSGGLTGFLDWIAKSVGMPFIPYPKEIVADGLHAASAVTEAAADAINSTEGGNFTLPEIPKIPQIPTLPTGLSSVAVASTAASGPTESSTPSTPQQGGARSVPAMGSSGPIIAGALSALVAAGGLKAAYDFLSSR